MTLRSTRASAAVARLNSRSEGHRYLMVVTGAGLFNLQEQVEGVYKQLSAALSLDEFVKLVDAMGPQKIRRITKNDAAFAKQLIRKPKE
ncbi:MAG: hypothetical protein WCK63_13285 [Betaproteobacteria bacterium]